MEMADCLVSISAGSAQIPYTPAPWIRELTTMSPEAHILLHCASLAEYDWRIRTTHKTFPRSNIEASQLKLGAGPKEDCLNRCQVADI